MLPWTKPFPQPWVDVSGDNHVSQLDADMVEHALTWTGLLLWLSATNFQRRLKRG